MPSENTFENQIEKMNETSDFLENSRRRALGLPIKRTSPESIKERLKNIPWYGSRGVPKVE